MTVKELIEILEACNQDALITVQEHQVPPTRITASMVWATEDGLNVIFNLDHIEEN